MKQFISIIIPIPSFEKNIQNYRFKYDIFAKFGIPVHITLMYKIPISIYNENKIYINNILKKMLEILNKNGITFNGFVKKERLFAIDLDKKDIKIINKMRKIISNALNISLNKYESNVFDPHITIFTSSNNPGWKEVNNIEKKLKDKFPITINIDKFWILEIDTRYNKNNLIDIITL
jgi:2'-5' RNA ligase